MELTDSQKIIVNQFAALAGCEATLPAVLGRIDELKAGYHAGRRALFMMIGGMTKPQRDDVMDRLIAMESKK